MYRFYVDENSINDNNILLTGSDVNHIKNVLRLGLGERIIICDGKGRDYYCQIAQVSKDQILTKIFDIKTNETELPSKIYLFQGIPKQDKMELIIQKAVELGVYEIIPVSTKRTIVKFNNKKKENNKLERWQTIAKAAAKQSNRGIIPSILEVMSFQDALDYSKELEIKLIPYEKARNIQTTRNIIQGGFEETEVETSKDYGFTPISLGRRILRTETAGIAIISMLMLELED